MNRRPRLRALMVITEDAERWRIYSINRAGLQRSFVALNLSSPTVLTAEVARLEWSEVDCAWRLKPHSEG